jgi:hypothetical protein
MLRIYFSILPVNPFQIKIIKRKFTPGNNHSDIYLIHPIVLNQNADEKTRHYNLTADYNFLTSNAIKTTIESNRDKAMGILDRNKTDGSPRKKTRNEKYIYQAPKQSSASISQIHNDCNDSNLAASLNSIDKLFLEADHNSRSK